jgi:hypothetical protein
MKASQSSRLVQVAFKVSVLNGVALLHAMITRGLSKNRAHLRNRHQVQKNTVSSFKIVKSSI